MSAKVFWLLLAALAVLGIALFRYHAATNPQGIDSRAAEEIEKAKQR
jgi:quinol-cytochrome oxidoreductase complex cytochrome b subunit